MEIIINGKTLDASIDNENTLGEVLANLEDWLSKSGHRISELKVDGEIVNASMIEDIFNRELKDIKIIAISTNVVAELTAASLLNLLEDLTDYENLNFESKADFFSKWKDTATAMFISAEIPDLFAFCKSTFSSGEMTSLTLRSIIEEIQREVQTPVAEIKNIEPVLNEICERLIRLPLDIQTGKDSTAAQTIQIFSAVTEKVFRIFRQLDTQGYFAEENSVTPVNGKPLASLITGFGNVLEELLEAYEKSDSVLVGDLTEYEAAPKLKELYTAILQRIKND